MPEYEDKPGDIVIFRNDKATPENKQPEYNGTFINQAGEKCNVALWVRTSNKSGKKFFSGRLEFEPYRQNSPSEPEQQYNAFPQTPPDDEVPF